MQSKKKPKTRREIINANAFRAGGAAARLREEFRRVNNALLEARQAGIAVEVFVRKTYTGDHDTDPPRVYLEAELTRGKRKQMKTSIIVAPGE